MPEKPISVPSVVPANPPDAPTRSLRRGRDRTPSFYTSRSILNLSGLSVSDPAVDSDGAHASADIYEGGYALRHTPSIDGLMDDVAVEPARWQDMPVDDEAVSPYSTRPTGDSGPSIKK